MGLFSRKRTTPKARFDVLKILPDLAKMRTTAVRLHPRRGKVAALGGSKLGGSFLWPADEPWPTCNDPVHDEANSCVPVIQLRRRDFPEIVFPNDADLFQLFWCPATDHEDYYGHPKAFAFWRNSKSITPTTEELSSPQSYEYGYIPQQCKFFPERVIEYPHICSLSEAMVEALEAANLRSAYQFELSTCPSNKVGGFVHWVQDPVKSTCPQDHPMDLLLTLGDAELLASSDDYPLGRWLPKEDEWVRITEKKIGGWNDKMRAMSNAADWDFGHGCYFFFVCRQCEGWPVTFIHQR